jgi:uncharacterized protein (DUF1697 family)
VSQAVVLLRGINVGGRNRLAMADFRALLTELGAVDPVTYLQSGQAVVTLPPSATMPAASAQAFAVAVHDGLIARCGLDVAVMVRSGDRVAAVIAGNPYPEREATPKQLHVIFFDTLPSAETVAAVGTRYGDDEFSVGDGVLYVSYAGPGSHDSPLVPALRKVAAAGTARNWTTMLALQQLLSQR